VTNVQQVRARLLESKLLSSDDIDSSLESWRLAGGSDDDGDSYIASLVEQGRLTGFQGEALLAGHAGPYLLGPYRVSERIVSGVLGSIYRAEHVEFGQPVSLKVFPAALNQDPEQFARMGREVRVSVSLDHPNVVRSFQVGRVGDVHYLALEPLTGETLANLLEREGRLPVGRACRLARDVARGLSHLHQHEIIHRDVRPDNIWVTENGVAKLMEFGGARDSLDFLDVLDGEDETPAAAETVVGQYEYMAPEQAQEIADADSRSDIYALGCTLYHCLTGQPPFEHKDPVKLVLKHVNEPLPPVSTISDDVPRPLDETVAGMLAKDPAERFQRAEEVAWALDQYAEDDSQVESVVVQEVSPQYLEWVQKQHPAPQKTVSDEGVGVSPELTEFLSWMTTRQSRRKR